MSNSIYSEPAAVVFQYDLSLSRLDTICTVPIESPNGGEAVLCPTDDTYTVFALGKTLLVVNRRNRQWFRIKHLTVGSLRNYHILPIYDFPERLRPESVG